MGYLKRACGFCGTMIYYDTDPTKKPFISAKVSCEACNKTFEYELKWNRYQNAAKAIDPFFGLDLWLQTTITDGTIWLYNIDHLNYLMEYIEADLRDDNYRFKYCMITNLPKWIKSAKNRDLILKKLRQLKDDFEKRF